MPEKKKKKREIPLRNPGDPVSLSNNRPSLLLFQEVKDLEDVESQFQKNKESSIVEDLGAQTDDIGRPKDLQSDAQKDTVGHPNEVDLSAQTNKLGHPNTEPLDTQTETIGHPNEVDLGVLAPKSKIRAPKTDIDLGANTPKEENLGTQKNVSTESYRKYEKARSTASIHIRADSGIIKQVQHFIVENKETISTMREFFEFAAAKLMEEFGNPKNKNLGTNTPYDDRRLKILYKSRPFIINLYLAYNTIFNELAESGGKKWSARWSPRDDESAHRYNELEPAIIELGILQTQIQKGFGSSRIQTFKYYSDEIEKVISSGVSDEMLQTILIYHRNIWKNQTGREVDLSFLES